MQSDELNVPELIDTLNEVGIPTAVLDDPDDMVDLSSEIFQTPSAVKHPRTTVHPPTGPQCHPQCPLCKDPGCHARENELRQYSGWEDLTAHCGEEEIVGWVNQLAHLLAKRREVAKKTMVKRRETEKALRQFAARNGFGV